MLHEWVLGVPSNCGMVLGAWDHKLQEDTALLWQVAAKWSCAHRNRFPFASNL